MRKFTTTLIAGTALAFAGAISGTASAQEDGEEPNRTYQIEGTISDTSLVGGVGDEGAAFLSASWNEKLTIRRTDGTVMAELTAECVGMTQPQNSLFERHVACTHSNGRGSTGGVIMGCSREGGGKMSCMGRFHGREGTVKDEWAMHVVVYDFNDEGTGTVAGSGYWQGKRGDDEAEGEE